MIYRLFLISIIALCNANFDPNGRLDVTDPLEIKDKSGNVLLKRANTDAATVWKLGTIDGVDLSKYAALARSAYKHRQNYEWTKFWDNRDAERDEDGKNVYLRVDTNDVFGGLFPDQLTTDFPTEIAPICANAEILCYPNKKDPTDLYEKQATGTKRPTVLSRRVAPGHDGLDAKVHPTAKWPWRSPADNCGLNRLREISISCPEYEVSVNNVAKNKWSKIIWNLVGTQNQKPATKHKVEMVFDGTTHHYEWKKRGGVPIWPGKRAYADPSKIKVGETVHHFGVGVGDIWRDNQAATVGECVMNTVNTLLGNNLVAPERFWSNKQFYLEFCAPYGGAGSGLCKDSKLLAFIPRGKYATFSDATVDQALAKVGAFEYQLDDVNDIYGKLDTDDSHLLLGIRISYFVKGGPGGHWELPWWLGSLRIKKFNFKHSTAFVWKGDKWFYVNSHTVKAIHSYDSALEMIQDIKKNFNGYNVIHAVRILAQNTPTLTATPSTIVRNKQMVEPDQGGQGSVQIQQLGGNMVTRRYNKFQMDMAKTIPTHTSHQEYGNVYGVVDQYENDDYGFSNYDYSNLEFKLNSQYQVILLLGVMLVMVICVCSLLVICSCSCLFYEKNKKEIQQFVGFV